MTEQQKQEEQEEEVPGYETDLSTAKGGIKHDADKPRVALVPPQALLQVAAVFTYGAKKYRPWNWARGMSSTRLASAAMRHILAWVAGEDDDVESGLPHLAHAACCVLMLIESIELATVVDDRLDRDAIATPKPRPVADSSGNLRHPERRQLLEEIHRLTELLHGKRD